MTNIVKLEQDTLFFFLKFNKLHWKSEIIYICKDLDDFLYTMINNFSTLCQPLSLSLWDPTFLIQHSIPFASYCQHVRPHTHTPSNSYISIFAYMSYILHTIPHFHITLFYAYVNKKLSHFKLSTMLPSNDS